MDDEVWVDEDEEDNTELALLIDSVWRHVEAEGSRKSTYNNNNKIVIIK